MSAEDYESKVTMMGNDNGTLRPVMVDADGAIVLAGLDAVEITADMAEAQTWDSPLVSVISNLNRIRYAIIHLSGEAWGTFSHSIAAIWAKFNASTGHAHSGSVDDGQPVDHGTTTNRDHDDHTQYLNETRHDTTTRHTLGSVVPHDAASGVTPDTSEAQTWDATLTTLVNNLNRIRSQVIALSGEAWGTVTTSTAALWAKFHATTGHKHTAAAGDAPVLPYSGLSGLPDTDLTPYTKKDGSRAFTGDQSMGSHKLTNVTDPTSAQDAATQNFVNGKFPAWTDWTSALVWGTATPTDLTVTAKYIVIGKICIIAFDAIASDSKGCTSLTATLPVTEVSARVVPLSGLENTWTTSYIWTNPLAYIYNGSPTLIQFFGLLPGTNGKQIEIVAFGFYPIA